MKITKLTTGNGRKFSSKTGNVVLEMEARPNRSKKANTLTIKTKNRTVHLDGKQINALKKIISESASYRSLENLIYVY